MWKVGRKWKFENRQDANFANEVQEMANIFLEVKEIKSRKRRK